MLDSLGEWLAGRLLGGAADEVSPDAPSAVPPGAVRMSAGRPLAGVGRVRLRLRVASDLADGWRGLKEQARRWLPQGMSWLRFACLSVWRGWQHLLGVAVAYGGIYVRDRHR